MSTEKPSVNVAKKPADPAPVETMAPAVDPRLLTGSVDYRAHFGDLLRMLRAGDMKGAGRVVGLILGGYLAPFWRRLRSGELGAVPVVVGLIVIWAIFTSLNSRFLTAENLSNISIAMVGTGMIAVGIVFVLLLGEIDLSVGSVSGVTGSIAAVLAVQQGVNEWLAVLLAIISGAVIGALHGFFFARVGAPAFAVTLAGLLFWQGLMLRILGQNGTINLDSDGVIVNLTSYYFSDVAAAYGLAVVAVAAYFLAGLRDIRRRVAAGVPSRPVGGLVARTVFLAIVAFAVAMMYNQYKGLPLALVIFLAVLLLTDFVARRTSYGRKVYALGGSVEASRRAGINVTLVRISVFSIAGTFAAVGGLFLASKIAAANQGAGQSDLLMNTIAAAVIGGTSLFGGRGRTWNALLGVVVITSIQYGLALEGIATAIQYMITGGVLLATVCIDSISRRTQRTAGRA